MTDLTPERLAELRRIAEAATPGPLTVHLCDDARYAAFVDAPHLGPDAPELAVFLIERDARFFAEFDRDTALALLDRIEALEAENERLRQIEAAARTLVDTAFEVPGPDEYVYQAVRVDYFDTLAALLKGEEGNWG